MKKNALIISVISVLILVVFISGCTTNNNTSNQSNQNIIVQVTSSSQWNGTLTYNGTKFNINGTKNKNYNLGTNPGAVTIYLQKNNDVGGNLTVKLLQGSNIIETQSTSLQKEIINMSHNF
jgi:hypothetical protein